MGPWLLLSLACSAEEDTAVELTGRTPPQRTEAPCTEAELDPLGPSEPVVGDVWTVWLRCDGTTLTGAMVLQITPPTMGTFNDNLLTFVEAGQGVLKAQVGSYVDEQDVVVGEAPGR